METYEIRIKRLKLRSWRRGTKEMDLILGGFADTHLTQLSLGELDAHERLMDENDNDLYQWISQQSAPPEKFAPAIRLLREHFLKNK